MRLGLPRASRQGPLGPCIAGLQGRWDEKQAMYLMNFPYSLNFGKSQLTLSWCFCFLPGNKRKMK